MAGRCSARYVALLVFGSLSMNAWGQQANQACGVPPLVPANAQPNIFSEQQEEWLGDAMAEAVEADFVPIRDERLNAHLQRIVDRLAATLPETTIHFRVRLIDSAEVNGFSIAGGRMYLTRKLAAGARSDDELASVIGHEMGHIASHQFAFETTRDMKRFLGVTSVSDRADVFEKFQRLTEARTRDKITNGTDSDDKQDEADRIGVYVIAAAGFRPLATPEFWDRMVYTQGHKGSALANFFGISRPNERRLGRMLKEVQALPAGCGGPAALPDAEFAAWHERVIENRSVQPTVVAGATEVRLTPALRMDLDRLRFSPDGQYMLAQDEGSVFVIRRSDLQVLLQTDANGALPAQFSPDSKRLVFTTQGLHTEEWDIAGKRLLAAHEPMTKEPCIQAKISPDGRTIICMSLSDESHEMNLSLLDVADGSVVWKKEAFFQPSYTYLMFLVLGHGDRWSRDLVPSSFSPDGNYLLIGPDTAKVALDLRTRTPIKVGSDLHNHVDGAYAFLGNDRVVGVNMLSPKESGIFSFPDGRPLKRSELHFTSLQSVSAMDGSGFAVADGFRDFRVSVANLDNGRLLAGAYTPAIDVWNGTVAFESTDGSVELRPIAGPAGQEQHVKLPLSDLAMVRTAALSPDGKLLALSTRWRGAVWNLETGRAEGSIPGFDGASWAPGNVLFLQFPKRGKEERHILGIHLESKQATPVPYSLDQSELEYGLLREWRDVGKNGKEIVLRGVADGKERWRKQFPDGMPGYTASVGASDLLFSSPLTWSSAKALLHADSKLNSEASALKKQENGRLIEVFDAETGAPRGRVVIDLPGEYAGVAGLNRVGDLLYVASSDNRTLVYSMGDGSIVRQLYGELLASDLPTGRVCMQDAHDQVKVYDRGGRMLSEIKVSKPVRFASFTDRGNRVMLVGADQVVRTANADAAETTGRAIAGVTVTSTTAQKR